MASKMTNFNAEDAEVTQRKSISSSAPSSASSALKNTVRAFSLIEMLVVLAISSILLGLIITPLVTTFNFTNRARRNVEVQDAARYGMEVVSRELGDAMHVVVNAGDEEPFVYYTGGTPGKGDAVVVRSVGGLNAYDQTGKAWELGNAMIDVILPHDTLGLEGGGVGQPLSMQHVTASDGTEHPIIVRYFVGLTNPGATNGSGKPIWRNNVVLTGSQKENLYTLYRVEFDPYDPRYSKWVVDSGQKMPDKTTEIYTLNPDFFYDNTVVSFGGVSMSQAKWWRKAAVAIMPTDTMDLVDFQLKYPLQPWNAGGNPYLGARSLITFNPFSQTADSASVKTEGREPSTYETQYGHWTGLQNNGAQVYSTARPINQPGYLPHITVYHQDRDPDTGASTLQTVYDSAATGDTGPDGLNRVLAWNSLKGTVEFSLQAPDFSDMVSESDANSLFDPLSTLPTFGGAVKNPVITAGSETVQVNEGTRSDPSWRTYSRSDTKDVYEVPAAVAGANLPAQLPAPRTYIITPADPNVSGDHQHVLIGYPYPSEANPEQSQPVPNGKEVRISYFYQNNQPDDLVKVDYETREQITINMTARMYDPVNKHPIVTTLANRVRLRNIQR